MSALPLHHDPQPQEMRGPTPHTPPRRPAPTLARTSTGPMLEGAKTMQVQRPSRCLFRPKEARATATAPELLAAPAARSR
eukprot:8674683-Alexandrium_andersonii.AAC.1